MIHTPWSFLQEAYLTVNYDRGNFTISWCTWAQGGSENIISILSPSYGNSVSKFYDHNLKHFEIRDGQK